MAKSNFKKFYAPKSNAQIKEEFKQAKRQARAEKKAYFEEKKKLEIEKRNPSGTAKRNMAGPKAAPGFKGEAKALFPMPLNKFIAHGGICSRREAADLIKEGKVTVNGKEVLEPGFKVNESDVVKFGNKKVTPQKELVYILLNKPKDYITTSDDPQGRKTVIDLVKGATEQRVYPVGRLDRNTTGVLLLTNDGELTQKLSHPSFQVKKVYEVKLNKPLLKSDFQQLLEGVTLEDGFIAPDALGYADPKDKTVVGVEIHSGRNRIVRRMFEFLGYDVRGLDRVMFANLTKKNVDRGKWRYLNEKEVRLLKFLNKSFVKKKEEQKAKNRDEE